MSCDSSYNGDKVSLEFNFSFSGFSFSGLDPNFLSGFKPEIHFIFQFQFLLISQQLLIFYKTQQSNPGFELFSHLIISFLLSSSSDLEFSFSNLGSDLKLRFSNPGSDLEFRFSNPGSDLEFSFSNPGLFEFQV